MLEEEGDVYSRLARSIAPEIWGHEDVKKVNPHSALRFGIRHTALVALQSSSLCQGIAAITVRQRSSVHVGNVQALLLVLVGGVTKEMDDGMRLRGDIHACLMGARAGCSGHSPVAD